MSARRRHVGGSEVERDFAGARSYGSLYRHDDDNAAGRLLSEETVDLSNEQSATTMTMTSRDRTNEFVNAIRSMQSRAITTQTTMVNQKNPLRRHQVQSYSNFMMIAKNISKNIASTYTKLDKLALCKDSVCVRIESKKMQNMLHCVILISCFSGQEKVYIQ